MSLIYLFVIRSWRRNPSSTHQEAMHWRFLRGPLYSVQVQTHQWWTSVLSDLQRNIWRHPCLLAAEGCNLAKTCNCCSHSSFYPGHRNVFWAHVFACRSHYGGQTVSIEFRNGWRSARSAWTGEITFLSVYIPLDWSWTHFLTFYIFDILYVLIRCCV